MDHTKVDVLCATARLVVPVVSRTKSAIWSVFEIGGARSAVSAGVAAT
jgi:hypothetical protein